jgi:hypothetical protein
MKLVILGAGNVATHLTRALHDAGHEILAVYSRTLAHASEVATPIGAVATSCVKSLPSAEAYILSVKDDALPMLLSELIDAHPKRAMANLSNQRNGYDIRDFKVSIAIAPTKLNERTEWFLEKATEIGIDEVKLFSSYHSERRVANVDRFKKIVISAMKQSVKSKMPIVEDMVSFDKLVKQNYEGQKFIAWIDDNVKEQLQELVNPDRMYERLGVDILCLQVGEGLLPIADSDQDGILLAQMAALRQVLTDELGYIIPNIRIMDCSLLDNDEYCISVRNNKVATGFVYPNKCMINADEWDSKVGELPEKAFTE